MSSRTLTTAAAGFEAARALDLPLLPAGHRLRRLHGHGFQAAVRADLPAGWGAFPGQELARLRERMTGLAAALDYRPLEETLAAPGDARLAHWWAHQLADVPGCCQVSLRSAPDAGVDVDDAGRLLAWRRDGFHAAHWLPHVPEGHKCGRLHGHGFAVVLHVRVPEADRAQAADVAAHGGAEVRALEALDALWAPLKARLDHACLNSLPGLHNPTSEVISAWIWAELKPQCPALAWVTVYETASSGASFDGADHRIWKQLTLDSAVRLRRAPDGHPARAVHGHTYTLRLHLAAPLHEVLGWTVDFGDVKRLFDPLFKAMDHHPLHEIDDLPDCDAATIAHWVLAKGRAELPQMERVDLQERPGSGVIALARADQTVLPL